MVCVHRHALRRPAALDLGRLQTVCATARMRLCAASCAHTPCPLSGPARASHALRMHQHVAAHQGRLERVALGDKHLLQRLLLRGKLALQRRLVHRQALLHLRAGPRAQPALPW